jgi:WhiB family redox-sensing transcriptional regulator
MAFRWRAETLSNPQCVVSRTTWKERPASGRPNEMTHTTHEDTPAWQFHAACRGEDSGLFFAPSYFEQRAEKEAREAKAKAICAHCPVLIDCLEFAVRIRENHGVWGGLNESERRALVRERERRAVS